MMDSSGLVRTTRRIVGRRVVRRRRSQSIVFRLLPSSLILLIEHFNARARIRKRRKLDWHSSAKVVTCRLGERKTANLRIKISGFEHVCFTDRPEGIPRYWHVRPVEYWASSDQLTQSWLRSHFPRFFDSISRTEWIESEVDEDAPSGVSTGSRRWFGDQEVLFPRRRRFDSPPPLSSNTLSATVVVPVHDAPDDVRRCLDSVVRTLGDLHRLIIVDDGSAAETAEICDHFAREANVTMIRRPIGSGFPAAANAGLAIVATPFVIVLNSDTRVPQGWIERLVAHLERHHEVAAVGPLSNAARFQSIPHLPKSGNDLRNERPDGLDLETMNEFLRLWSMGVAPVRVPQLNGFCLAIRRSALDQIGNFDTTGFPRGFGEENDWCARATRADFDLLVATDVYVEHAKGRSYDPTEIKDLKSHAARVLVERYGREGLDADLTAMRYPAALVALRADTQALWHEWQSSTGKEK